MGYDIIILCFYTSLSYYINIIIKSSNLYIKKSIKKQCTFDEKKNIAT